MENITNKTVILNGTEVKLSDYNGDNVEIHNFGSSTIYASKFPNITADADNVIAVSPKAIDGFTGVHGSVYLLGTGKVQVTFTDGPIAKTSGVEGGADNTLGGDNSAEALAAANEYTDSKTAEALNAAKEYSDDKTTAVIGIAKEYVNDRNAETIAAAKNYADALNSDLSGYIGYTDSDIYGLEADFENNRFTRLAGAVGKNAGADFDNVRAYGGRRRCNLSDSGEVLAYYGDDGFAADGSNGQVMVEQPRFYYKVVPLKTEKIDGADGYHLRKARYYISDTPKAGFKVHPAFVRNGVEVDKIYLSAFEGCIYDTSAGAYLLNNEQVADFNIDKLGSIADVKPASGKTQALSMANVKKMIGNNGIGWNITTIQTSSATQLLFIIEYAMFNSQEAIGNGVANATEVIRTGSTSSLGNASGTVTSGGVSYRGEENLWGNVWHFVDNIAVRRVNRRAVYSIEDKDIMSVDYRVGYISAFGYNSDFDWLFNPSETSGNSALPIGDTSNGTEGAGQSIIVGGSFNRGDRVGLFLQANNSSVSAYYYDLGPRLIYIPQEMTANN